MTPKVFFVLHKRLIKYNFQSTGQHEIVNSTKLVVILGKGKKTSKFEKSNGEERKEISTSFSTSFQNL